jgi:radical SAM protein with 4Fe4S-binding SPASM domain
MLAELRETLLDIAKLSLDHYHRHSEIPVAFLRSRPALVKKTLLNRPMCAIAVGRSLVVDVDGAVLPCQAFLRSVARPAALDSAFETARLGMIWDEGADLQIENAKHAVRNLSIVRRKADKWSSYEKCAECSAFANCIVCPVSNGHIPTNLDPNRVPDLPCAFNKASFEAAQFFWRSLDERKG